MSLSLSTITNPAKCVLWTKLEVTFKTGLSALKALSHFSLTLTLLSREHWSPLTGDES